MDLTRRGLLAAIPGLGLLSRLRGKKEEPAETLAEVYRRAVDDEASRQRRHLDALQAHLDLAANPMLIVREGYPELAGWKCRPGSVYRGPGNAGWYTDPNGKIRTAPGWRGAVDFRSKPTFAELSRQWDSA